jgi:uncharacterized protein YndB with AHSA1/START domain
MSKLKNKTVIVVEPGKQEIVITRELDAPRELVFKAFTEAKLYEQWLGPRRLTTKFDRFEPKDGGGYRFINKDEQGNVFAFHGIYHEVTSPERIIGTFEYEGLPEKGHVSLEITTFESLPYGRTKLTAKDIFTSVADRDAMWQSGMEEGINDSYDRLEELLTRTK